MNSVGNHFSSFGKIRKEPEKTELSNKFWTTDSSAPSHRRKRIKKILKKKCSKNKLNFLVYKITILPVRKMFQKPLKPFICIFFKFILWKMLKNVRRQPPKIGNVFFVYGPISMLKKPLDSPLIVLSKVFWVQSDQTINSISNSRNLKKTVDVIRQNLATFEWNSTGIWLFLGAKGLEEDNKSGPTSNPPSGAWKNVPNCSKLSPLVNRWPQRGHVGPPHFFTNLCALILFFKKYVFQCFNEIWNFNKIVEFLEFLKKIIFLKNWNFWWKIATLR